MSRARDTVRVMCQRESAKRFGITHPRLNYLLRGKIGKFSLKALVNMLDHDGMRVEIRVRKAAA